MKDLLTILVKRLDNMEKMKEEEKVSTERKMENLIEAKVKEYLDESAEVEKRKLNLVLVNIKESNSTNIEEAKQEDKVRITKMLNDIIPEEIEISDPIRLGKPNLGSKPRLLRITAKDLRTKAIILKKAQRLNKADTPGPKIYINPDYTQKQRENHRQLKEREENGEKNLKVDYKNMTITTKPIAQAGRAEAPSDSQEWLSLDHINTDHFVNSDATCNVNVNTSSLNPSFYLDETVNKSSFSNKNITDRGNITSPPLWEKDKDDDDMIFTDYVLRMFQEDEIIHIETDRVQKTETFIIL